MNFKLNHRTSIVELIEFTQENSYWLYIVPWGINKAVTYVKETYGNPTMILSENGMDQPGNVSITQGVHDTVRIRYYRNYITELKKAIDDGAKVIGYFAWSLLDNFEWRLGYTSRFGIVYVELWTIVYKTLKSYPQGLKRSGSRTCSPERRGTKVCRLIIKASKASSLPLSEFRTKLTLAYAHLSTLVAIIKCEK